MARTQATATIATNHRVQSRLRDKGLLARAQLSDSEKDFASDRISDTIIYSSWFQRSSHIACYLPMADEVDTWSIVARAWRMKKRIFAPVVEKNHAMGFREITAESGLSRNRFGLLEPEVGEMIRPRNLDLVLTPIVAFDDDGNRIGMGGGYFDRTFSFLKRRRVLIRPKLIGLAFSCQRVEKIPPNPWDIRVFRVISELS